MSYASSNTELDYLGPLYIKTSNGALQVWVCLLLGMVTRAIHLEVIQDMTTAEFLLQLKPFISKRGAPLVIISDTAA